MCSRSWLFSTSEFSKDLIVCDNSKGKDKQVCSSVSKLMARHIWAAENSAGWDCRKSIPVLFLVFSDQKVMQTDKHWVCLWGFISPVILVSLSELFFLYLHHCLLFYLESIETKIKDVGLLAILTTNASIGNLYQQNVKNDMLLSE